MPETARSETVGSLLRPASLLQAREAHRDGKLPLAELRALEDAAILDAIKLQKDVGLDVITDGEFRRAGWNPSTSSAPDAPFAGYSLVTDYRPAYFGFWRDNKGNPRDMTTFPPGSVITSPMRLQRDIATEEYAFLSKNAGYRTKYTFTAPSYHRHFWTEKHSSGAYKTLDEYLIAVRDLVRREVVDKVVAMGCDYIQLDAPNYGQAYTEAQVRRALEAEGRDLEADVIGDAELDNSVFDGLTGITRAIHVCRGNGGGGYWSASGGYEHFAQQMFPRLSNIDALLLEYDTERAGGFEPLQYAAPHTTVVLGLLTTKEGKLEDNAAVEARVREASRYVPLERLALSTQCGFASSGAGNPLSVEEQRAKLELVTDVARRVWR